MIYPIYAYGHPVLKKENEDVELNKEDIKKLLSDMYETMYHCKGIGLAAPQIGLSKRVFIVDSTKINSDDNRMDKSEKGIKEAFINAEIIDQFDGTVSLEEGCLSIPNVYGNVQREKSIKIQYYDADLEFQEREFTGFTARVIQHEYDHIEGILFTEKLKPLKKQLLRKKLEAIKKGQIPLRYKMKFYKP